MKGGKMTKMAEEVKENDGKETEEKEEEQTNEEISETVGEKPTESSKEETEEKEEGLSEENISRLSEDIILTKIANLSSELQKRKQISSEEARFRKIEGNILRLSEDVKNLVIKLQEEKEEETEEKEEEENNEKLSESKPNPKSIPKMEEDNGFFTLSGDKPSKGNEEFAAMLKG